MSKNQCDGCRRGIPINKNGIHIGPGGFWHGDYQSCTADRYKDLCDCDMRTKLVGDGCSVCNPDLWADLLSEDDDE